MPTHSETTKISFGTALATNNGGPGAHPADARQELGRVKYG